MCVYIYIMCIYLCVCIYMYISIRVYIYIYMCVYIYIYSFPVGNTSYRLYILVDFFIYLPHLHCCFQFFSGLSINDFTVNYEYFYCSHVVMLVIYSFSLFFCRLEWIYLILFPGLVDLVRLPDIMSGSRDLPGEWRLLFNMTLLVSCFG